MLNVNNIRFVQYKTESNNTGFHHSYSLFTHQVSPPNAFTRTQSLSARLTVVGADALF
jgi:hypothetical protein